MRKPERVFQPCSEEEAKDHLIKFAHAFVAEEHIPRWLHIVIERPEKAKREITKFENYLNRERCYLMKGAELFSSSLSKKYGNQLGVYFDGDGPAVLKTAAEAGEWRPDAVFSLKPGKLAVFFFHEGWAWHCEQ